MSIKHLIKFRFQQISLIIEMMNCIFDTIKDQAPLQRIKIFEYFLGTLKETITNADYVNTDDEEIEEKDII